MAQPGPAPMPRALKLAGGTSEGRDAHGHKVAPGPLFDRTAPTMPSVIREDEYARAEWEAIVPILAGMELLKPIDKGALTAYCLNWSRMLAAQDDIKVNGIVVEGQKGNQVKNPAVAVAEAAGREMRMWAAEFGLTPASEARLVRPPEQPDENDAAFD